MLKSITILQIFILVTSAMVPVHQNHHHPNDNYEFSYGVNDRLTGDIKHQHEVRHGGVVHGEYSLIEPDGHRRIVEYHADDIHGFNAIVHREGEVHPPHGFYHHGPVVHTKPFLNQPHAPIPYSHHASVHAGPDSNVGHYHHNPHPHAHHH